MRCLLTTIMALFLATPAFASDTICEITGPHNCREQIETRLDAITKNTIHAMNLAHPGHAFKTENDAILEKAASKQAALGAVFQQSHPNISSSK